MTLRASRDRVTGNRDADAPAPRCQLCAHADVAIAHRDGARAYYACPHCHLIFLDPARRLTPLLEILRYLEHRNSADDSGYRAFLSRLAEPVRRRLAPGALGLDYGCGPVPVLGALLTAAGHPTDSYDPVFHPEDALLARRYDFATCSEVAEHAHDPRRLFARLGDVVVRGGLIGVMTRFHGVEAPFATWWYRRDPTHVCFYEARTLSWIAEHFGWTVELPAAHLAIFRT